MIILGIDPGTTVSGVCLCEPHKELPIISMGILGNESLIDSLKGGRTFHMVDVVAIELFASYGMPVGESSFDTVRWTGRFEQVVKDMLALEIVWMPRRLVKLSLCNSVRAKDSNVRQALIDMYGGSKEKAIGTKKNQGPLYGMKSHVWPAFGVAVTYYLQELERKRLEGKR